MDVGTTLKGYELRERIGAGGHGAVYRAVQSTVGREVAVKIILPGLANQPDFIRRFEAEAQLIARLEHPHITPLYDYWRDPEGAYLVMRWLRGGSVRDALQKGPLDTSSVAVLLDQLTSALSLAHRSGVIHRDLKPGNILLDEDGNGYLADFGIAKDLNTQSANTNPDAIVGSLDYISPEQARSEPVTPRTDIYSLGVVLFELLSGHHPFENMTSVERLYKHVSEPLPEVTSLDPAFADAVNQVIQKATAKNPDHRYSEATALAADFREAAGLNRTPTSQPVIELLTQREHEILGLVVDGLSNKEIAERLTVTVGTVKWYVNQIFAKLHVRSRVQAIIRARELNLIGKTPAAVDSVSSISNGVEPENPYKGLRAFQAADEQDFFGREDLTQKLLKRLSGDGVGALREAPLQPDSVASHFLAVVGPSGSGKSSLVKAGLIPALWRGAIPESGDRSGSERWYVVEMLPGAHPLDKLEVALLRVAANVSGNLHEQLARDERGLVRVADLILPNDGGELLLVVDQFEEVFTLVEDEVARQQFLALLTAAVTERDSRVRVVITMRADFYDRPLRYAEFGELVRTHMETVMPLSAKGLERAISGPAERVGVKFEPGLVAAIVAEMNYQAGALPLMQYGLTELFERREGRRLTQKAYQEVGGAVGALAKRAEELYTELSPEGQEAARQMFMRLVTVGDGGNDTRRRTPRSELLAIANPTPGLRAMNPTPGLRAMNPTPGPSPYTERGENTENGRGTVGAVREPPLQQADADLIDDVIDAYAAYRLLTLDNDPATRAPTVELAHEAILTEWKRLRAWLDESRDDIRLQRQLASLSAEWEAARREKSFLLSGVRLDTFEKWAADATMALTPTERAFLQASLDERERQAAAEKTRQQREFHLERRSVMFLRGLVAVLLVAVLGASGLTAAALNQSQIAQAALVSADSQRQRADNEARIATARELTAYSVSLRDSDPELSTLLALQAVNTTYAADGRALPEAETELHQALQALHIPLTIPNQENYPTQGGAPVLFSPDGSEIATTIVNYDHPLMTKIWDATTRQLLFTLPGNVISPSWMDQTLITSDYDAEHGPTFTLWDVSSHQGGRQISTVTLPLPGRLDRVSMTQNFTLVAVAVNGISSLWDLTTGQQVDTPAVRNLPDTSWSLSPDGTRMVVPDNGGATTLRVFDTATWQELYTLPHNGCSCVNVQFSADSSRIITSWNDGKTIVWDAVNGSALYTVSSGTEDTATALNADGTRLVTGSSAGQITLWDTTSWQVLFRLNALGSISALNFSPDGGRLVAMTSPGGETFVWSITPGHELLTLVNGAQVETSGTRSVAYNPDGQRLVAANNDQTPVVWDASSGRELFTLSGADARVLDVAWSPDGAHIATGSVDSRTRIWDADTGQLLLTLSGHRGGIRSVAFSPDGTRLVTGSLDDTARVWDTTSGQSLLTLTGHRGTVLGIAYSPDGSRIATVSADQTARVWDAVTGQLLVTLTSQNGHFDDITFSADGRQMATAGYDKTVNIWDAQTGALLRTLNGHTAAVEAVAYSPDGMYLASASYDGTVRLWDANTGEEALTLYGASEGVFDLAFSPDGTRLATMNLDGTTRIYVLPIQDLMALAESRVSRSLTAAECQRYLHVDTCPLLPQYRLPTPAPELTAESTPG